MVTSKHSTLLHYIICTSIQCSSSIVQGPLKKWKEHCKIDHGLLGKTKKPRDVRGGGAREVMVPQHQLCNPIPTRGVGQIMPTTLLPTPSPSPLQSFGRCSISVLKRKTLVSKYMKRISSAQSTLNFDICQIHSTQ